MILYGIERPDGTLVECEPRESKYDAWMNASHTGIPSTLVRVDVKTSGEFWAACYRAHGTAGWGSALAQEIGTLMGYKLVEVEVLKKVLE